MRGGYSKTYIKISVTGWLHGSIRWQLTSEERGVWADLITLAGQCRLEGLIADNDRRPYPMDYIASHFNITQELLDTTLEKCQKEGRIELRDNGIFLVNFKDYQDEYSRQKPYRDAKKNDPDKYTKGRYGHMVQR